MQPLTNLQALQRLRSLYRDAFKCDPDNDQVVIRWAEAPETWAQHQIIARGWSWHAVEAVVRSCRSLRKRASIAAAELQNAREAEVEAELTA
jgi:hypothetical protein